MLQSEVVFFFFKDFFLAKYGMIMLFNTLMCTSSALANRNHIFIHCPSTLYQPSEKLL